MNYRIITNSLDTSNDYIVIYLCKPGYNMQYITDGGDTIENFELKGYPVNNRRMRKIFMIANSFLGDADCEIEEIDIDKKELRFECNFGFHLYNISNFEDLLAYLNRLFERGYRRMGRRKRDA